MYRLHYIRIIWQKTAHVRLRDELCRCNIYRKIYFLNVSCCAMRALRLTAVFLSIRMLRLFLLQITTVLLDVFFLFGTFNMFSVSPAFGTRFNSRARLTCDLVIIRDLVITQSIVPLISSYAFMNPFLVQYFLLISSPSLILVIFSSGMFTPRNWL